MNKKLQPPTLNKITLMQQFIARLGYDNEQAEAAVNLLYECMHDTLMKEGKVIFKNIGTLETKPVPAKIFKSFGVKKKVPARYKLKFVQSRNFELRKSPLKNLTTEDILNDISKLDFSKD